MYILWLFEKSKPSYLKINLNNYIKISLMPVSAGTLVGTYANLIALQ